jgi:hypothetical protein
MGAYSFWLNTGATAEGLRALNEMDMNDLYEAKMALLWKAEIERRQSSANETISKMRGR